ncbi:Nuclease SbcCD subunit D [Neolewinella maritima]|uniref:Nuclease SbcCD subunit D n=1 Tax=Neolewinella maritima TaxID=1383882 RepID=A0ABM9AXG9_9BACT|nr:exonuclease SbcCD subunit D C-terminal domain-containing protein [Neolewinella maritima]CAH0999411.1 Nuclease SbcCD subunit D [Neolewinella maritima]
MRILHTADWHLGHRLYNRDRSDEHRAALKWLLQTVASERVDVVIVAGDVFDVTNPSNQAKELYYEFLAGLRGTCCTAAVIVGGNHDSPSLLNAPRSLMKALQLHVVGAADTPAAERVVRIQCREQEVLIAAVPYLRERDLRTARFGETVEDRADALRTGIRDHFEEIATAAVAQRSHDAVPIVATGHLFAAGASDDEEKKSYIYQANEQNIEAGAFPGCFDYVALGHIHRAQRVGDQQHIRYAGSLVPLTFVEGQAARSVRIVDIGRAGEPVSSRKVPVPYARTLLRLRYELPEIKRRLAEAVRSDTVHTLTPWAEVRVLSDDPIPNLREKLLKHLRDVQAECGSETTIELIRISRERLTPHSAMNGHDPIQQQLDELDPLEVFSQLCARAQPSEEMATALRHDFLVLRDWINEEPA